MAVNIRRSPRFIKAKSEAQLQYKMAVLQLQLSKELSWLSIYPVKGGVVGWYYDDSDFERIINIAKTLER